MLLGAGLFVRYVQQVAVALGAPALILSLLIAPFATELPEKFNSILWVRSGKDTLAIGNITGAMVFQSCIPMSLGILFTNWSAAANNTISFLSAGAAIVSSTLIFGIMLMRGRLKAHMLLTGGIWYVAYVIAVFTLFNR